MAEKDEILVDSVVSESAEGFSVSNSQPFFPKISREYAESEDGQGIIVSDLKLSFNQAYIYNRTSATQVQDRQERAIGGVGMDEEYSLGFEAGEQKFFCKVVVEPENFLIKEAEVVVVKGEDLENIGTDEGINTEFPHILFDGIDIPEEMGPFTGYFPICTIEDQVLTEYTQRSNIQLSDRQFRQKGLSTEDSAHILITGLSSDEQPEEGGWGYKSETLPVRVRTISGGSGITVVEQDEYIIIHATGSGDGVGDWSGQNIGVGAEVYDEYSLLPSQFRTLSGVENVEITQGVNEIEIKSEDSLCGSVSDADWWAYVEDSIRPAKFRGLKAGTGVYFDGDDCVTTISVETGACCTGEKEIEVETIYSHSNHTTFIQFPPDNPNSQKFVVNDIPVMEMDTGSDISFGKVTDNCIKVTTYGHTEKRNWSDGKKYSEENIDSNLDGVQQIFDRTEALSSEIGSNSSKEGSVKTYNAAGTQTTNEMSADGAGNAVQKQKNSAGTIVNQTAADTSTDTYFNAGPVGLGTSEPSAGYAVDVKGTAKVFSSSTPADGLIQLGTATNQTMGVVGGSSNFVYGAGVTSFSSDSDQTLDVFTTNSAGYSAVDAYIIGSSPATGSAILAGSGNSISGHYNVIAAGANNLISGKSMNFIGGGSGVDVIDSEFSVSVGGRNNDISGSSWSVLNGGYDNLITGGNVNNVGGGYSNEIRNVFASVIAGGHDNLISGTLDSSTAIAGGVNNEIINSTYAFIGAGGTNVIKENSDGGVIVGGVGNQLKGTSAFIGGGRENVVSGTYGVALGSFAKVQQGHNGAFVFSDANLLSNFSSGANTMVMGFRSGVYIQTDSGLYVNGNPVLTGETPEGDTLQTVTARGNLTTTDILSEGEISGASGEFGGQVSVLGKLAVGTIYSSYNATIDGTLQIKDIDGGSYDGLLFTSNVGGEGRIAATNTDHGTKHPLQLKGEYIRFLAQTGTAVEAMRIVQGGDGSGSVGIGTSDPDSKLHIYAANPNIFLEESDATSTFNITDFQLAGGALNINTRQSNGAFVSTDYQIAKNANGATDHKFFITGSEKVRIDSDGYVGIGISSPDTKLHLEDGRLTIKGNGSEAIKVTNSDIVNFDLSTVRADLFRASAVSDQLEFRGGSNRTRLLNSDGGTELFTITNSGDVGIGVSDPDATLEIQNGTTSAAVYGLNINDMFKVRSDGVIYWGSAYSYGYQSWTTNKAIVGGLGGRDLGLHANGAEKITIKTDGKVGIGTTAPNSKLHLSAGSLEITSGSHIMTNGYSITWGTGNASKIYAGDGVQDMAFTAGSTEAMRINGSSQNVGIGTNAPAYKLDVNGTIHGTSGNFEDGITVNGNPVLTGTSAYETDTLQTVTDDGNTTTNSIYINGSGDDANYAPLNVSGNTTLAFFRGTGTAAYLQFQNSTTSYGMSSRQGLTVGNNGNDAYVMQREAAPLYFGTSGEARMTIMGDSATHSKVGIGTLSPDSPAGSDSFLDIFGAQDAGLVISSNNGTWDLKNTNPNADLVFYRDGSTRVTFAQAGNVGIGSATPSEKLDVKGSIILRGSTNHRYKVANDSNNNWAEIGNDGASSQNTLEFFTKSSSVPAMSITNDDGVGIGTTTPYAYDTTGTKLHVKNTGSGISEVARFEGSSDADGAGAIVRIGTSNDRGVYLEGGRTGDVPYASIGTTEYDGAKTEAIHIDSAGRIGMGTNTPSGLLSTANRLVVGDGAGSEGMTIYSDASSNGAIYFANGTAGAQTYRGWVEYRHGNDRLDLGAGGGRRMVINGNGVGIGTYTVTSKLEVSGAYLDSLAKFRNGSNAVEITDDAEIQASGWISSHSTGTSRIYTSEIVGDATANSLMIETDGAGNRTRLANYGTSTHLLIEGKGNNSDIHLNSREAIRFYTSGSASAYSYGSQKMTIAADGNVGIGTSSPDAFLNIYNTSTTSSAADVHIVGSGNSYGLLYERLRNDSLIVSKSTTAGSYFKTDSATVSFQGYEIGTNWFLGQYGYNDFRITDGTKSGGTAALTIQDATQNVGIGVTNPTNKLEIWGQDIKLRASTVDARLTLSASDSVVNNSILNFGDNDSSSIGQIKYAHNGDSMRFQTNSSEAMRIDSSGYVGIGTSSPSYELDVNGTTRSTYYIGGAYLEENVSSSKLKFYTDGTVLVMDEDGSLKPCEEENDTLVFGVSKKDFDQPVVLGAEPVLVTGPIKVGDYIVTSSKQGHGQAMKEEKLGTIIAQAMGDGDGESYNIKAMVRKM